MMKSERRNLILKLIDQEGRVEVSDLAKRWHVSEMTVRRDLAALVEEGMISRTHGGAVALRKSALEFRFHEREERCSEEKRAIGAFVARMVKEGMTISLDTGTTTLSVARELNTKGLTILTTSLPIAWTLAVRDNVEVVLSGGTMRRLSPDLSGPVAEDNIRRFHVNMAIVGADAVSPGGAFTNETSVARITHALMENADRVILVVDHTKFGASAFVRYARLEDFDLIVVDDACPNNIRQWLKKCPTDVAFAPINRHRR